MTATKTVDKFKSLFPQLFEHVKRYRIPTHSNNIMDIIMDDNSDLLFVMRNDGTWNLEGSWGKKQ